MIKGWDIKTLRNDLKTLEALLRKEQNETIKTQIKSYIAETKRVIIEEEINGYDKQYVTQNRLIDLYRTVPIFELYYPIVEEYLKKLKKAEAIPYYFEQDTEENEHLPFNNQEMLDLVHELFKTFPSDICNLHNRVYEREDHIRFDKIPRENREGRIIFIPGLNKPYLEVGEKDNKRIMLSTLVHEEGHAVASLINPRRYTDDNCGYFLEIESIFFELIGNDYFKKELNNPAFSLDTLYKISSYDYIAKKILEQKRLATECFRKNNPINPNRHLTDDSLRECLIDLNLNGCQINFYMKYLVGFIIAIELFEIYKKDKELAFEYLKEIVKNTTSENEYEQIARNVTPNKSLIKFKKRITKSVNE